MDHHGKPTGAFCFSDQGLQSAAPPFEMLADEPIMLGAQDLYRLSLFELYLHGATAPDDFAFFPKFDAAAFALHDTGSSVARSAMGS